MLWQLRAVVQVLALVLMVVVAALTMMASPLQLRLLMLLSCVTLSCAFHLGFSRVKTDCGKERSGENGAIGTRPATHLERRFQQSANRLYYVKQRQIQTGFVLGLGPEAKSETKAPAAAVPPYDPF